MKASKILRQAHRSLRSGYSIRPDSPINDWVQKWLSKHNPNKRSKKHSLISVIGINLALGGGIEPNNPIHQSINLWLASRLTKKAKRKAKQEAKKEAFVNGAICGRPKKPLVFSGSVVDESRIPVWGTNERVVSRQDLEQRQSKAGVFANVTVEEVEAAAKKACRPNG